jgi:centromere/kinetochore protein ZW10
MSSVDILTHTRLQGVLTKSKYYTAIGMVTDAALSRILEDMLALPDIPEMESHRLSELCRILNALEGLFVEDPDPNQVGDSCVVLTSLIC